MSPLNGDAPQAADGVGDVHAVGIAQIVKMEHALLHPSDEDLSLGTPLFDFRAGLEKMPPENSGEKAAFNWRRKPLAVSLDKHIADGAFCYFTAQIQEQRVVETAALCFEMFECVEVALGRLVVERGVGGIGAVRRDAYSNDLIGIGI